VVLDIFGVEVDVSGEVLNKAGWAGEDELSIRLSFRGVEDDARSFVLFAIMVGQLTGFCYSGWRVASVQPKLPSSVHTFSAEKSTRLWLFCPQHNFAFPG